MAFIPTGLVKLAGRRFTTLPSTDPVGAFLEAMYQTGVYWNFIGLSQVVAGILLLIPATATLGAVIFLPIVLNIAVLTWSLDFTGTVSVSMLMVLANLFLLCWDYDRIRSILVRPSRHPGVGPVAIASLERAGFVLGGASGIVAMLATRAFVPAAAAGLAVVSGLVASVMLLAAWVRAGTQRA
jgi:hypothetical protein